MAELVNFMRGLQESYDAIFETLTDNDLFFTLDTDRLYRGQHLIAPRGGGGSGTVSDLMIEVKRSELLALRDNSALTPGMQYRITDYDCTTSQPGTSADAHGFDIILVADDESHLNENARAATRKGDMYFSPEDCEVLNINNAAFEDYNDDGALYQFSLSNGPVTGGTWWVPESQISDYQPNFDSYLNYLLNQQVGFNGYGYEANNNGEIVPVLYAYFGEYENDQPAVSQFTGNVYLDRYFYEGRYFVEPLIETGQLLQRGHEEQVSSVGSIDDLGEGWYDLWRKIDGTTPVTPVTPSSPVVIEQRGDKKSGGEANEISPGRYGWDGEEYYIATFPIVDGVFKPGTKIGSWKLKYSLDNDTEKFSWAKQGAPDYFWVEALEDKTVLGITEYVQYSEEQPADYQTGEEQEYAENNGYGYQLFVSNDKKNWQTFPYNEFFDNDDVLRGGNGGEYTQMEHQVLINGSQLLLVHAGDRVYFKGYGDINQFHSEYSETVLPYFYTYSLDNNNYIPRTNVGGTLCSLIYGDDYPSHVDDVTDCKLYGIFGHEFDGYGNWERASDFNELDTWMNIVSAKQLHLPPNSAYGYGFMFMNHENLVEGPACLPDCVGPSTGQTEINGGYCNIGNLYYAYMFFGCGSLQKSPIINGGTIDGMERCFEGMFSGCTSLTEVYCIAEATTTPAPENVEMYYDSEQFDGWLYGVPSNGILHVKGDSNIEWDELVPNGWTIQYDGVRSAYPEEYSIGGGKGVIYYMKDEFGNECPYDFKNIMFIRYPDNCFNDGTNEAWMCPYGDTLKSEYDEIVDTGESKYYHTFDFAGYDTTIFGFVKDNVIGPRYGIHDFNNTPSGQIILNDNVFYGSNIVGNRFGIDCYNNTLGDYVFGNTFGNAFHDNKILNGYFMDNTIFDNVFNNRLYGGGVDDGTTYFFKNVQFMNGTNGIDETDCFEEEGQQRGGEEYQQLSTIVELTPASIIGTSEETVQAIGMSREEIITWCPPYLAERANPIMWTNGSDEGKVLTVTDANGNIGWSAIPQTNGVPTGNVTGTVLTRTGTTDTAYTWQSQNFVPTGNTTGMVLTRTGTSSGDYAWSGLPSVNEVPTGSVTGTVLTRTGTSSGDYAWSGLPSVNEVPTGNVTGTVLTRTGTASGDYAWVAPGGGGGGGGGADLYSSVTYSQLTGLVASSGLVPGQMYRITDYVCTTVQENTSAAAHQFDIVVVATSTCDLNENAWATHHNGDTYFSGCNLNAWQIKYSLKNDTDRFAWADSGNGKGVVYYMKDEWNNECPYDFKNIMFARWEILSGGQSEYCSGFVTGTVTNPYNFYYGCYDMYGADNIDMGDVDFGNSAYFYTFALKDLETETWHDYTVLNALNLNVGDEGDYWKMVCHDNKISDYSEPDEGLKMLNNVVFFNCYSDISDTSSSEDYSVCERNYLDIGCADMTFGTNQVSNIFEPYCTKIVFGNACYGNKIGFQSYRTKMYGANISNIIGNASFSINLYENCNYNKIGDGVYSVTMRQHCEYNNIENGSSVIELLGYCKNVTILGGCHGFKISGGTSNSLVKNIYIFSGVYYSPTFPTLVFEGNKEYTQFAGMNTAGTLKIGNLMDLIN